MRTKFALVVAAACSLPLAPAVADMHANGTRLNGVRLNGIKVNGLQLNGAKLNGRLLNGLQLNGVKLNGASESGLTTFEDGSLAVETVTLPNGVVVKGR